MAKPAPSGPPAGRGWDTRPESRLGSHSACTRLSVTLDEPFEETPFYRMIHVALAETLPVSAPTPASLVQGFGVSGPRMRSPHPPRPPPRVLGLVGLGHVDAPRPFLATGGPPAGWFPVWWVGDDGAGRLSGRPLGQGKPRGRARRRGEGGSGSCTWGGRKTRGFLAVPRGPPALRAPGLQRRQLSPRACQGGETSDAWVHECVWGQGLGAGEVLERG